MDDSVLAAIARWPNVPHVYGWLSLDRRGKWRLQDSPITNPQVTEFIGRNYAADERGAWFFQNGPQRVYVQLGYTPWILRVGEQRQLMTHTGTAIHTVHQALLDENGNMLIAFEGGIGLLDDRDLSAAVESVVDQDGRPAGDVALARLMEGETLPLWLRWLHWTGRDLPLVPVRSNKVAHIYGFIAAPHLEASE